MNNRSVIVISAILCAIAGLLAGLALADKFHVNPFSTASSIHSSTQAPAGASTTPVDIVSIEETASTSPTVTVEYPQFPDLPAAFNDAIASATLSRLSQFRQAAAETMKARAATGDPSAVLPASDYDFIASWQPAQMNSRYVSFIERYDSYSGGANGNQELQTFNYDVAGHRSMTLADLFPGVSGPYGKIASQARTQLISSLTTASGGNAPISMIDAGTTADPANFADFTFTDYLVTVYFPKYAVAPGSFGEQHVTVVRSSIR